MGIWIEFAVMAAVVIGSGIYLSKFGDVIAEETGIGQILVGSILIALATSLPELVTSVTSALVGAPNIAIGNVFGSNNFNLLVLVLADFLYNRGPLLHKAERNHILSGLLASLLVLIVIFGIMLRQFTFFELSIWGIGLESILLLLTYIAGMKLIFKYKAKTESDEVEKQVETEEEIELRKALIGFIISGILIFLAGTRLSITGNKIAAITGLEETFIGTILIAAATSLPELVTSLSAIRIGAYNLVIGNVLGSNILNMTIVFFADLFYRSGSILGAVNVTHIFTAVIGLLMLVVTLIGLFYRSQRIIFKVGWDSLEIGRASCRERV